MSERKIYYEAICHECKSLKKCLGLEELRDSARATGFAGLALFSVIWFGICLLGSTYGMKPQISSVIVWSAICSLFIGVSIIWVDYARNELHKLDCSKWKYLEASEK